MRSILLLLALSSALACGPEEPPPSFGGICEGHEDDVLSAGLTASSASFDVTLRTLNPSAPGEGFNIWELEVMSDGTMREDLTLTFTPYMPEHQHGPPATTSTFDAGVYPSGNLDLFMPGYWEVTVDLDDGTSNESVVFAHCIE